MTACHRSAATPSQGRLPLLCNAAVKSSLCAGLMYSFRVGRRLCSVAFAEALCTDGDPHVQRFNQSQIRYHLKLCLERGVVTNFPEAAKRKRGCRSRMRMSRKVYVYAHVAYLGISKERWHSVSLVRRIVYTFLKPFSWTLYCLSVWACSDCKQF